MSVTIEIKSAGLFKKKVTFAELPKLLGADMKVGIKNHANVFEETDGQEGSYFTVYRPARIGRGFGVELKNGGRTVSLYLNDPSTDGDISDYYDAVFRIARFLKAKHYYNQDHEGHSFLSKLADEKEQKIASTRSFLKGIFGKFDNMTIFGAINPIDLQEQMIMQIRTAVTDEEAMRIYADYLDQKQRQDYYYAKATLYRKGDQDAVLGVYTLTEGALSVFPVRPVTDANQTGNVEVSEWRLALVGEVNGSLGMMGWVGFDQGIAYLQKLPHEVYDKSHIMVQLSHQQIQELLAQGAVQ